MYNFTASNWTKIITLRDGVIAQGAPDPSYESVSYLFPPDEKIWEMTSVVNTYVHGDGAQFEQLTISYLPDKMFDLMMKHSVTEDTAVSWMHFYIDHFNVCSHILFFAHASNVCLGTLRPTSFVHHFKICYKKSWNVIWFYRGGQVCRDKQIANICILSQFPHFMSWPTKQTCCPAIKDDGWKKTANTGKQRLNQIWKTCSKKPLVLSHLWCPRNSARSFKCLQVYSKHLVKNANESLSFFHLLLMRDHKWFADCLGTGFNHVESTKVFANYFNHGFLVKLYL